MKNLSDEAVAALARKIGIDAQEITRRKAFLEFDETDVSLLTELHARLQDVSQHFVNDFYTHLIKFEETRRFIPDAPSLERLKRTQTDYFNSLTAGDYGPDYALQRLRVGVVHQHIGLEPKWYIGAYSKYLVGLLPELWRLLGDDPDKFLATYHALQKIAFLDMGLALDTYIQADRRAILGLKKYADDIIASLPAGLIVVNGTLKVRSVNRSFREMFRLENGEDVFGRELEDLLPLPDLRQQAQAVLASGMTLRGIDIAQGEKWLRLTITGIRLAEEEEEEEEELLVVVEDITELKAQAGHIEQLAFYDHLTGLPNRRLLYDRLQQALSVSTRDHLHGAVLMLDLDNFKRINDTRGHDVGDRLLTEVARRIQSCVRETDTVARLGGDEFIVVLTDLSADEAQAALQAERVGEKIRAAINQPCMLANQLHHGSTSMGLCLFPGQNATLDELLKRADSAMYQAKSSGRNALCFYDPQIQASLETRMALESELRNALPNNQFQLYYQIQVDNTQGVLGAEVLLRWQHPKHGLVLPDQFIPMAEESGLILPMGEWVLRTACEQLKVWATDPATEKFVLAVNVSARQFRQPDFVAMVCQIMAQTGINPDKLKLELTESLVLHNIVDTIDKMKALNQQGVHFSMDDFGTGYSSLSQLTRLPIQQLKLDRSFVSNIDTNHNDAVVVQTIIGMAHNLGLRLIAEGVETQEQRACLERFGCTSYQGYLYGRPMPLHEFEALALQVTATEVN
ncbi:MAG: EAL domain-containing protein [Rhodoferax sp.]|uniref:EAL domain-containing protein n=1 Tax=Rhodoferax sp. TaxID=50421 RepID=UPI0017F4E9C5|nr:EAL domain-containing protein [Rhodoferax sp.]NMM14696.1 EAL domain-containing protein [Rhodoferax sp.]